MNTVLGIILELYHGLIVMGFSSLMSNLEGDIFKRFSQNGNYFVLYRTRLDYVNREYESFFPQGMVTESVSVQIIWKSREMAVEVNKMLRL